MGYVEELKQCIYGGLYPYVFASSSAMDKIHKALDKTGFKMIVIENPDLLTEGEAKKLLDALRE